MTHAISRLRSVLGRREILSLCLMILTADVVAGIIAPSFSLFATSLNASMALIGTLSAVEGLTRIISSVPVGILSDMRGRKDVLTVGMLAFGLAAFGFTLVSNPVWLIPMRMLIGLAMIATFFVGMAYIGDQVVERDRGLVIGLYSTFMGSGFAVGSAVGGWSAASYGYHTAFFIAAGVAVLGSLIGRWGLASGDKTYTRATASVTAKAPDRPTTSRWALLKNRNILAASVANMGNNMWYSGLVVSFFALWADQHGLGQALIGGMFAVRAVMSTLARLPTGVITTRISARKLMLAALAMASVAVIGISVSTTRLVLTLFLAVEGIAYGMFLASGSAYITQQGDDESRGAAVGIYSTFGGIGSTGGPFLLGFIAQWWGIQAVFWAMAALIVVCVVVVLAVARGKGETKMPTETRTC